MWSGWSGSSSDTLHHKVYGRSTQNEPENELRMQNLTADISSLSYHASNVYV